MESASLKVSIGEQGGRGYIMFTIQVKLKKDRVVRVYPYGKRCVERVYLQEITQAQNFPVLRN